MIFLDKTGLTALWSKIKSLVSKYLPLTGGTITGDLMVDGTVTTHGVTISLSDGDYELDIEKCKELGILSLAWGGQ